MIPDLFIWIEFRGIARKIGQRDCSLALFGKSLDCPEWREVKAHLGCYSSFSTCGSFDGVKEHLLANNSHLIDEFFKLSMVVNSSTKKFGLLVGKGDGGGLGFDFSGPAPVALWALAKATLSHPIQG